MNASFTAAGLAWFDHPHEYHLLGLPDGDRFDDCAVKLTEGITAEIRSSTSNPLYLGLMLILTVPEITFLVTEKGREESGASVAKGMLCNGKASVLRCGQMIIKDLPCAVETQGKSVTLQLNAETNQITQADILCFDCAYYRIDQIIKEPAADDNCGILKLQCSFLSVQR